MWTQILQMLLMLTILVVLHEFGHYLTAKWFKCRVEKFYLFFNPWFSLFKKKIGETEWGIGWLPLGGYVKIAGMIDESMDKEQMKQPAQPWEFRSKPAWQRLIIMLGGIIVNVLLAWFIYTMLLTVNGDTYLPVSNLKQGVYVDEKGEQLGFKTGDKILSVDGKPVERYSDLMLDVILSDEVIVERNGKQETITITDEGLKTVFTGLSNPFLTPRFEAKLGTVVDSMTAYKSGLRAGDKIIKIDGKPITFWSDFKTYVSNIPESKNAVITIQRDNQMLDKTVFVEKGKPIGVAVNADLTALTKTDNYSFFQAIPKGLQQTWNVLAKQVKQFKVIFKPKTEAYKQVKGPIGIVEMMPDTWDWTFFWSFTAMFSVWLAFINLLPIPALDGGHAMFLLYEMITGREPSQKVLEVGQIVGFVILALLMLIIFGNDIWNLFK